MKANAMETKSISLRNRISSSSDHSWNMMRQAQNTFFDSYYALQPFNRILNSSIKTHGTVSQYSEINYSYPNSSKIYGTCSSTLEPKIFYNKQYDIVCGRLLTYTSLTDDWDGYGGKPPSFSAIQDAISFLNILPNTLPMPKTEVGGDGMVGLYWDLNGIFAEVGFYGNGTFFYFAEAKDEGEENQGDDLELDGISSLPEGLERVLAKLTLKT